MNLKIKTKEFFPHSLGQKCECTLYTGKYNIYLMISTFNSHEFSCFITINKLRFLLVYGTHLLKIFPNPSPLTTERITVRALKSSYSSSHRNSPFIAALRIWILVWFLLKEQAHCSQSLSSEWTPVVWKEGIECVCAINYNVFKIYFIDYAIIVFPIFYSFAPSTQYPPSLQQYPP